MKKCQNRQCSKNIDSRNRSMSENLAKLVKVGWQAAGGGMGGGGSCQAVGQAHRQL